MKLEASLGKITRPISKVTKAKWPESLVQAVEGLLFKHKALSSNPSPTKKKKKFQGPG
jgi:hypothetical protein